MTDDRQPFIDPRDPRTIPFSESDFSDQWALFRGRVFQTDDLRPFHREWKEWLAARDSRIRANQEEMDLAMHYAYRPEVVAEVAVCLDDDVDWERIAEWCGARIDTSQDPSGEYTSALILPDGQWGWRGSWIVKRLDGSFSVRSSVEAPDDGTLDRIRKEGAREALDGFASWLRESPDGASWGWEEDAACNAVEYRDTHYTKEDQ